MTMPVRDYIWLHDDQAQEPDVSALGVEIVRGAKVIRFATGHFAPPPHVLETMLILVNGVWETFPADFIDQCKQNRFFPPRIFSKFYNWSVVV